MERYDIRKATDKDLDDIVSIYNSNLKFLKNHLGYNKIDATFVQNEIKEMESHGFISCVIVEKGTNVVVGVIDYKPDTTVYLSLIMLSSHLHGKGNGSSIYRVFENSMREQGKKAIRIDVVNDYADNVISFWQKQGFVGQKETKLSWGNKTSNALVMQKVLSNIEIIK